MDLEYNYIGRHLKQFNGYQELFYCRTNVNPIWTGLFANVKRLGREGQNGPSSKLLAISSQMTLKLGKDILSLQIDIKF